MFESFIELDPPINIITYKGAEFSKATNKGLVKLVSNYGHQITLEDVLFAKEASHNLRSFHF